jgi:hypothetical protein
VCRLGWQGDNRQEPLDRPRYGNTVLAQGMIPGRHFRKHAGPVVTCNMITVAFRRQ